MKEINEERENNGKKPFDGPKPPEEKEISESTTDPECGIFTKASTKNAWHIRLRRLAIRTVMLWM